MHGEGRRQGPQAGMWGTAHTPAPFLLNEDLQLLYLCLASRQA